MKCKTLGLCLLLSGNIAMAQPALPRPLAVGDTLPDIVLTNLYNYPVAKAKFSSLDRRLIILDFWATWCAPCIESLPHLSVLQQQFSSDLLILLVNSQRTDTEKKVADFIRARMNRTGFSLMLPYMLGDTLLKSYLPHTYLPHYVWLNAAGKIIAITGKEAVTASNISQWLQQGSVQLPLKDDEQVFDPSRPLLVNKQAGSEDAFLYRSMLTTSQKHLGGMSGMVADSAGNHYRIYAVNASLAQLYRMAWPSIMVHQPNRTFFSSLPAPHNPDSLYCYEIITPPVSKSQLLSFMQQDMARFFRAVPHADFKKMDCYTITSHRAAAAAINSLTPSADLEPNTLRKYIHNQPLSSLLSLLNSVLDKPVIAEGPAIANINIEFPYDIYTWGFAQWQAFLSRKGYSLTRASRRLAVTIIK